MVTHEELSVSIQELNNLVDTAMRNLKKENTKLKKENTKLKEEIAIKIKYQHLDLDRLGKEYSYYDCVTYEHDLAGDEFLEFVKFFPIPFDDKPDSDDYDYWWVRENLGLPHNHLE
tara:strand:+ start:193 stop:540 length:348 start_codon:yes stop_codon:yes gene_type:complete